MVAVRKRDRVVDEAFVTCHTFAATSIDRKLGGRFTSHVSHVQ